MAGLRPYDWLDDWYDDGNAPFDSDNPDDELALLLYMRRITGDEPKEKIVWPTRRELLALTACAVVCGGACLMVAYVLWLWITVSPAS